MKRKIIIRIIIIVFFLAGLSLLLYPLISNEWNSYRQSRLISAYDAEIEKQEEAGSLDYAAEWEKADAYNESLLPSVLPDSFAVAAASDEDSEEHQAYMACLNLTGDGMMGRVEIPKISVNLPIYHTTDEDILEQAAGHLEGSSLPVGGASTHAVISAHRGLPSASLFTDLDRMEEGDHFLIHVLDEVLCYEVDRISVVEPAETQDLAVEEGEDLVTLLTCTPYGVNSHRLLVRGHRVPYEPAAVQEEAAGPVFGSSIHTNYLLWAVIGLAVTGTAVTLLVLRDRKRRRRAAENGSAPDAPDPPEERQDGEGK